MPETCSCCDQPLREPPEHGSVDLTDARPGDRWCATCHWVVLREVLADPAVRSRMACPTHGVPTSLKVDV